MFTLPFIQFSYHSNHTIPLPVTIPFNSLTVDSDLMDMADDSEFNTFLDKDNVNGPHLHNGKVKVTLGSNDIVMPQLKPPPLNPPPDAKPKVSLTKDGRLQKKRGPKPGPRNQTANKRPRLTRPVPKMVLKNLKVGTVESGGAVSGKNGNGKVSFTVLLSLADKLHLFEQKKNFIQIQGCGLSARKFVSSVPSSKLVPGY